MRLRSALLILLTLPLFVGCITAQEESVGHVLTSPAVINDLVATKATPKEVYSQLGQPSDVEITSKGFAWIYVKTTNENNTYYFPIPLPGPIIVLTSTGQILENIRITIQRIDFTLKGYVNQVASKQHTLQKFPQSTEEQYKGCLAIVQRVQKEMKRRRLGFQETLAWEKAEELWNARKFGVISS